MNEKETDVTPAEESASGADPSTAQEEVPSPEVKSEVPKQNEDKTSGLQTQVDNLNTALAKERAESKRTVDSLSQKLEDTNSAYSRIKEAFSPEEEEQSQVDYATKDELEEALNQKIEEFKEEQKRQEQVAVYKTEISKMTEEWDGKDGKPKYDDNEVLEWQKATGKTYLSPTDAFFQMKRDDVLDYEVKQRLSGAKSAENVETPSATPSVHEPGKQNDFDKNVNLDTRKAVLEAMEQMSKEQ